MYLKGKDVILMMNGTAIAAAKSCDLNVSAETIKVSSASDGQWEHSIAGRKSWKASCSHLVTSITDPVAMIGTTVTMRMQLKGVMGLPFGGFVNNVVTEQQSLSGAPDAIVWDTTRKAFLGRRGTMILNYKYYTNWYDAETYTNAATGTLFYNTATEYIYKKTASDLVAEALQGTAIVKDWKVTATLGNLASGSFQFEGSGELAPPTA